MHNWSWDVTSKSHHILFGQTSVGPFIYYVSTFLGYLDPLPPYISMFLVLKISKNWHFLTPPPYKCLRNIWMVPVISNDNFDWSLGRIGTFDLGADNQTHVGFFDIMFVLGSNCGHHINKSLDFFIICNIFLLFDPGSKKMNFHNLVLTKAKASLNCSWREKKIKSNNKWTLFPAHLLYLT